MYYKLSGKATQETSNPVSIMLWNQREIYYTFNYPIQFFKINTYCILTITWAIGNAYTHAYLYTTQTED